MQLSTTRFGKIRIDATDLFLFPQGVIGYEDRQRWVLLADAGNASIGWLQSAADPDVAFAVISPRRFVPDYRFHVTADQLAVLELAERDRAFVLNIVAKHQSGLTANLKAPLVFNLDRRLGCQVVAADEQPLNFGLLTTSSLYRKTA